MRVITALYVARTLLQEAPSLASPPPAPAGEQCSCEDAGLSAGLTAAYIIVCLVLIVLAGMMAGLTLGLLSIDKLDLEVVKRSGTPQERWLVSRIEPVIAHPHYLLATLLLTNAVALEMLPIFLDRLLNPVAAILISVTAILLFGEIVPQAVCKRYRLEIGAYLAWFVRILMFITAPITYPIGKLLDWMLGEEPMFFRRHELKALVHMHGEPADSEGHAPEEGLSQDEVQVIMGALDMATKTAEAAMTPLNKVFMFPSDAVVNDDLLRQVIDMGHSRVPVYEGSRENMIGLVLVKELLLVDEDAGIRIKDLRLRDMPFLRADTPMFDVLKIFRSARKHMAVLTYVPPPPPVKQPAMDAIVEGDKEGDHGESSHEGSPHAGGCIGEGGGAEAGAPIGIITIEDVLEELLQAEIVDETDKFVDNLQTKSARTLHAVPAELRHFMSRAYKDPNSRPSVEAVLAASVAVAATARQLTRTASGQLRPPSQQTAHREAASAPVTVVGEGSHHSAGAWQALMAAQQLQQQAGQQQAGQQQAGQQQLELGAAGPAAAAAGGEGSHHSAGGRDWSAHGGQELGQQPPAPQLGRGSGNGTSY